MGASRETDRDPGAWAGRIAGQPPEAIICWGGGDDREWPARCEFAPGTVRQPPEAIICWAEDDREWVSLESVATGGPQ